jgi:hypothetical protein
VIVSVAASIATGWLIYILLERPMLQLMGYRKDRARDAALPRPLQPQSVA